MSKTYDIKSQKINNLVCRQYAAPLLKDVSEVSQIKERNIYIIVKTTWNK